MHIRPYILMLSIMALLFSGLSSFMSNHIKEIQNSYNIYIALAHQQYTLIHKIGKEYFLFKLAKDFEKELETGDSLRQSISLLDYIQKTLLAGGSVKDLLPYSAKDYKLPPAMGKAFIRQSETREMSEKMVRAILNDINSSSPEKILNESLEKLWLLSAKKSLAAFKNQSSANLEEIIAAQKMSFIIAFLALTLCSLFVYFVAYKPLSQAQLISSDFHEKNRSSLSDKKYSNSILSLIKSEKNLKRTIYYFLIFNIITLVVFAISWHQTHLQRDDKALVNIIGQQQAILHEIDRDFVALKATSNTENRRKIAQSIARQIAILQKTEYTLLRYRSIPYGKFNNIDIDSSSENSYGRSSSTETPINGSESLETSDSIDMPISDDPYETTTGDSFLFSLDHTIIGLKKAAYQRKEFEQKLQYLCIGLICVTLMMSLLIRHKKKNLLMQVNAMASDPHILEDSIKNNAHKIDKTISLIRHALGEYA